MEMEPILGNIGIYYSNTLTLASEIPDYLDKIDLYPIQPMNNSIITGDYGIFKIYKKGSDISSFIFISFVQFITFYFF